MGCVRYIQSFNDIINIAHRFWYLSSVNYSLLPNMSKVYFLIAHFRNNNNNNLRYTRLMAPLDSKSYEIVCIQFNCKSIRISPLFECIILSIYLFIYLKVCRIYFAAAATHRLIGSTISKLPNYLWMRSLRYAQLSSILYACSLKLCRSCWRQWNEAWTKFIFPTARSAQLLF